MEKDLRTLIAIGTKLTMPNLSMNETIDHVNAICNNQLFGTLYPDQLTLDALKRYVSELMKGSWEDLSSRSVIWCHKVASLGSILSDAVYDLVNEAECRLSMNIPLEEPFVHPNLVHIELSQSEFDSIMAAFD